MTLLTTVIAPDFLLAATDTMPFDAQGRPLGGGVTKMVALPHARCLLAVQGSLDLLNFLVTNSWAFCSLDEADSEVPKLLVMAGRLMPGLVPMGVNVGSRVHLMGYSDTRGRMAHATWLSKDGFKTITPEVHTKASGSRIIATPPGPTPKAPVANVEGLARYVREQVAHLRANDPHENVGGFCVLARVDRHGVRITYGEDLGAPAGTVKAAEPVAMHAILREVSAAIYDLDTLFNTLDVSPNTGLPRPDVVEQITGVTVTSGTSTELDKSILSRTTVSWTAATTQQVRQSGTIEVQYRRGGEAVPTGDWSNVVVPGNATSATIVGLGQGIHYVFRVRARTTLGARGDWSILEIGQVATVPQVTTGGIEDEAATEVVTSALQAGPFNGGTGSITGSLVTVGTYGTAVRVVVHISGDYSAPNGTGGALVARSNFGLSDSVTGGVATGNTKIVRAQVPAGETFAVPLSHTAEFALAAGNSITVGAYFSDHASATANGSLGNVRTRVEVIKR